MKIEIPGKIFISGEYAALKGLPTLTVAVKPCFEFQKKPSLGNPFHPESPAGKLNAKIEGQFIDPFNGIGGLGRSTAEFLAAASETMDLKDEWKVWSLYREILAQDHNTPSGVDLLTQIRGGYCLTKTAEQSLVQLNWSFADLDWVALITGNKVKTHEHLAKPLQVDWQKAEQLCVNVVHGFRSGKSQEFVSALKAWRNFLFESQLEVPKTTELIDFFSEIPGVQAAKGCGALGSDVVFILFEKQKQELLEKSLQSWNPEQIIRSSNVCFEGLKVTNEIENLRTI